MFESTQVWHAFLKRGMGADEDGARASKYVSECPVCERPALFVKRNHVTSKLMRDDECFVCGFRVRYMDSTINGEFFE